MGRPVSKTITDEPASASTTPSSSTRTGRLERSASTRVYGLRGWTNTCSSSSNQASIAAQSKRTVPLSPAMG